MDYLKPHLDPNFPDTFPSPLGNNILSVDGLGITARSSLQTAASAYYEESYRALLGHILAGTREVFDWEREMYRRRKPQRENYGDEGMSSYAKIFIGTDQELQEKQYQMRRERNFFALDLGRRLLEISQEVEATRTCLRELQRANPRGLQLILEDPEGQYAASQVLA
jgi:hypothetical protein